jgi:hypothetical protein
MPCELRSCDNMDPAAGLGSLPERSVDVVITDPPYSSKVDERAGTATVVGTNHQGAPGGPGPCDRGTRRAAHSRSRNPC